MRLLMIGYRNTVGLSGTTYLLVSTGTYLQAYYNVLVLVIKYWIIASRMCTVLASTTVARVVKVPQCTYTSIVRPMLVVDSWHRNSLVMTQERHSIVVIVTMDQVWVRIVIL